MNSEVVDLFVPSKGFMSVCVWVRLFQTLLFECIVPLDGDIKPRMILDDPPFLLQLFVCFHLIPKTYKFQTQYKFQWNDVKKYFLFITFTLSWFLSCWLEPSALSCICRISPIKVNFKQCEASRVDVLQWSSPLKLFLSFYVLQHTNYIW